MNLEHGKIYGSLKVIGAAPSKSKGHSLRYWCGCSCGRRERYTAHALIRADGIRKRSRCRKAAV